MELIVNRKSSRPDDLQLFRYEHLRIFFLPVSKKGVNCGPAVELVSDLAGDARTAPEVRAICVV